MDADYDNGCIILSSAILLNFAFSIFLTHKVEACVIVRIRKFCICLAKVIAENQFSCKEKQILRRMQFF